ncbi:MAG: DUF11 domain-containing protein [Solirubrobacteraceae bacterium]|nr:DUF11 domain-containing protein [Solirubrobacteraceae bacterium]
MQTQSFSRLRAAAALLVLAVLALLPAAAHAAGSPNITFSADPAATVLQGETARVELSATNPLGEPYAYNLSYRAVLPVGVSYVPGSASGGLGAPTIRQDSPGVGQTTLLWINVADVSPNSTNTASFEVNHDPLEYPIGSTFTIDAGAYVNSDPRQVPKFAADGTPTPGPTSYTGFAVDSGGTLVTAIEIRKSEPSPEGELLRGVHNHQTTYTLTYRNNAIEPTDNVVIDDYLPAGLEFLGCGGPGSDQTTDAPTNPSSTEEYPGSGPITVPVVAGCVAPQLVETVSIDPDGAGPLPSGIYTHVQWTGLGTLGPSASSTINYRAAIPLRSNTLSWSGATPGTAGEQTANLDNNSGPEVADEQSLINGAFIQGDYNGTLPVTDDHTLTRSAEDLALQKSADLSSLAQLQLTEWTLRLRTSEYRYATAVTVTDTVPDGLCPIGSANFANTPSGSDSECDPVGGRTPSAPYTSAVEQSNGSYTVTWNSSTDAALAMLQPSTVHTISFPTRTRSNFQEAFADAGPILAGDTVSNTVATSGTANVICAPGAPDCSGAGTPIDHDGALATAVVDASSAGQTSTQPTIDKRVATTSSNCAADTYGNTVPSYRPGDRICWQLGITYPSALDTQGVVLTDFLPENVRYDATLNLGAGEIITPADTIPGTTLDNTTAITPGAPGGQLLWTLPSGGLVPQARRFERQIATTVSLDPTDASGDIIGNLFKTASQNTAGVSYPLRAQQNFELVTPEVSLQKRIVGLNSAPVGPTQNQTVSGGDVVDFRVTVNNAGAVTAEDVEVWDVLPTGITCAMVTSISGGGSCSAGTIRWGANPALGPNVLAGGSATLTYQVTVPTTVVPSQALTNTAGVREFFTPTNQGGSFTYIPQNNIDPTQNASANVPQARDTATITARALAITKARTSPVDGPNNTSARATIGEVLHYTITLTVPRGETVNDLSIVDPDVGTRQPLVLSSTTATLNGGALPGGFTISEAGGTPSLIFPATYTSGGADEVFVLEFDVTVADVAGNTRGGSNLTNRGRVIYDNALGVPVNLTSSTISTAIVEPVIGVTKADDTGGTPVVGGDEVVYTLTLANGAAGTPSSPAGNGTISPAHDTTLIDTVPAGLTPLNTLGNPIADGESTTSGGVWNLAARTLTFSPAARIEAGTTATFTYTARVNDPAVGGATLQNSVTTRTTSLAGTVAGERTSTSPTNTGYTATDTNTLVVQLATITKGADRTTLTIGDTVLYHLDVVLPASVDFYDMTVRDTLPDSIDFDAYSTITCSSGCPPETLPTVGQYTPVVNGNGTTTIAWDLGDLGPTTVPRTIRLLYRGHLRATHRNGGANVIAGETSINSATVASNRTNKNGPFNPSVIPPAGTFDDTAGPVTHTLTAIEPAVEIDKEISVNAGPYVDGPVTVQDGDALRYRIVVRNTGNAPLHDVTVRDTPDVELTGITLTTNSGLNVDGWTALNPAMEWLVPGPIAPGGTVTLGYDASLIAITSLSDGQLIDNTATAPTAYGVPAAQRLTDGFVYRSYSATPDSVQAALDSPTITLVKTTGAVGNPDSAPVQVGQAFTWRVVVTNTATTAGATSLSVTDTLPRDWDYIAGSATFSTGGALEPTVTPNAAGDQLSWSTSIALAAGASTTLTFQARPTLAAATSIGTGAGSPHVNSASAAVRNVAGNPADAGGPFTAGPDTASAILAIPTLTIAKTPDGGSAVAGQTTNFTIRVRNTAAVAATDVVVTDTFPSGTTYTAGSATAAPSTGFSETAAGASSASWTIASLAAGAQVDITVPLLVSASTPTGTNLVNGSSAVANETPTPVTDPGDVTTTASADLVASKLATPNPATAGQTLIYTLGVQNLGPSDAQNVELTDTLPATVSFQSASPGCTEAAGVVTCSIGTLANGATATRTITVLVDAGTTTNADNSVVASSTTPDPDLPNNTAGTTVPVGTDYDLSIVKTTTTPSILNGAQGQFRLAIANAGPSTATAVTVTDTLPAGLDYVSDDRGCAVAGSTLTCVLGTMAPADAQFINVVVRGTAVGTHTNVSTVAAAGSGTADRDPLNNTSEADITVTPSADLEIEKTAPATVTAGGTLPYTLEVTNNGPNDATGVVIDDTLPAGTTLESADPGCASLGGTPIVVRCTVGDLAVGASATRTITVRVPVSLGATAITNSAVVRGNEGDLVPPNDTDTAITQVGPAADLAITKTGPATVGAGGTLTWTMVVTNKGPSAATNVTVSDPIPAGTSYLGSATSMGTCAPSADASTLACELGTLAVGDAVQITLTTNVPESLGGQTVTNRATVTGTEPDPTPTDNEASATTTISVKPADTAQLSITKTANGPARVGLPLTYTITVTNNGPADAPQTVVTDALRGSVEFRSATPEQGTCTEAAGTLTCDLGLVKNGQTVRISVTVMVLAAGTLPNTATVSSPQADRVDTNNVAGATVQATQGPTRLALRKWLVQPRMIAGRKVSYRVEVRNTGREVATNVEVCDTLPRALTLRTAGNGTIRRGKLCFDIERLGIGRKRVFIVKATVSSTTRSTLIRNRASARADNAGTVTTTHDEPLVRVRSERTAGVTG